MRTGIIGLGTLLLCLWVLTSEPDANAANWPRFRGPNGTGVSTDKDIPVEWSDKGGILWKAPIPGVGNSSPIVWDDKIFLESASKDGKDRMLVCVNANDGKVVWAKNEPGGKAKTHNKNSLASSTPATDGERVYAAFWDGQSMDIHAFDFKGNHIWKRELGAYKSQHGAGNSPIVFEDKVFFLNDHDAGATLFALDAKTGKPLWQKDRPHYRACYSTPFIYEESGTTQLIVASTMAITGYDPKTGEQVWNWEWKFPGAKMPLRTVGSPVASNGLVFAYSGDGGGARMMVAIKLGGKGDITKTGLAWQKTKDTAYVPTLLASGAHLYSVNDSGRASCYEAKTGKELWNETVSDAFSASPVLIDGKVYAPGENGYVYVFAADPAYKLLAKNNIGGRLMASPAVANNRLFIRSDTELVCIGKK